MAGMLESIVIKNFKLFEDFSLDLNEHLNVLVGNNEAGKSTLLEAVNLGLTRRLNGRLIDYELSPYLFNRASVDRYLTALKKGENPPLPKILIELYFSENVELNKLRGSQNSRRSNSVGVKLEIEFNEDYREEYASLIRDDPGGMRVVPAEYYSIRWLSFADNAVTQRGLNVGVSYIDATTIQLHSGTDYYLKDIVQGSLDTKEQVALSMAYRKLKEKFAEEPSIKRINDKLVEHKGTISDKDLAISIDISQKTNWEANLTPHIDSMPFQFVGKGEQSALKIMLALERSAEKDSMVLIEEPENHLSFSMMRMLMERISKRYADKQMLIATHSAYVINKLGLESLILLDGCEKAKLSNLPPDTQSYFKRLSGYDTLRLVLAKKAVLVEGPSDELVVQKAHLDRYGNLPIENGIDVINVKGLSFKRFLDIAKELKRTIAVVTDNDGNYTENVVNRYVDYANEDCISIHSDQDNAYPTLEPQLVKWNGLEKINKVLGTTYTSENDLLDFMQRNKTECALRVFETSEPIVFPKYIEDAIQS